MPELKKPFVRPARYQVDLPGEFRDRVKNFAPSGQRILDVGAGRTPLLPVDERPPNTEYVGLDISASELGLAGSAYDEKIVGDVCTFHPELVDRFDLAVSWQVLEHVRPIQACADNLFEYLRPGGVFYSQLSGGLAVFSLLNRAIPHQLSKKILLSALKRDPETVFPAHYDHCTRTGLEETFQNWSHVEVVPYWLGAGYWRFSRTLERCYLKFEDWAATSGHDNWAPYYQVIAVR